MRSHRPKANENAEKTLHYITQNVIYTKQKRILFKSGYETESETEIIVSFRYAFSLIEYSFSLPSGLIQNIKKFH